MKTETKNVVEMMTSNNAAYTVILNTVRGMEAITAKDAADLLSKEGIEKPEKVSEKPGSVEALYEFMENGPRTAEETKKWIKANMNKTNVGITGFHLRTLKLVNRLLKSKESIS